MDDHRAQDAAHHATSVDQAAGQPARARPQAGQNLRAGRDGDHSGLTLLPNGRKGVTARTGRPGLELGTMTELESANSLEEAIQLGRSVEPYR